MTHLCAPWVNGSVHIKQRLSLALTNTLGPQGTTLMCPALPWNVKTNGVWSWQTDDTPSQYYAVQEVQIIHCHDWSHLTRRETGRRDVVAGRRGRVHPRIDSLDPVLHRSFQTRWNKFIGERKSAQAQKTYCCTILGKHAIYDNAVVCCDTDMR